MEREREKEKKKTLIFLFKNLRLIHIPNLVHASNSPNSKSLNSDYMVVENFKETNAVLIQGQEMETWEK